MLVISEILTAHNFGKLFAENLPQNKNYGATMLEDYREIMCNKDLSAKVAYRRILVILRKTNKPLIILIFAVEKYSKQAGNKAVTVKKGHLKVFTGSRCYMHAA